MSGQSPADEILEVIHRTFAAISSLNLAALERILPPDYRYISWRGQLQNREQRIGALRGLVGTQDAESFELSELDVRLFGAMAVVTGKSHQRGRFRGARFDNEYRFTTVLEHRGAIWSPVSHQATRVDDG